MQGVEKNRSEKQANRQSKKNKEKRQYFEIRIRFFSPEFLIIPRQMTREISGWKNSTCLGKLRCMFLILKEDLEKKHTEKLERKMMANVLYVKGQLQKAYESGLRRYWRIRKKNKKWKIQ